MDGNVSMIYPPPPLPNPQIVTLYGSYGDDESMPPTGPAYNHYPDGVNLGKLIIPICADGSTPAPNCANGQQPQIVFLFIGFSNLDIEIGGGSSDIWEFGGAQQKGQPCATLCPNLDNSGGSPPWNEPPDGFAEESFLRQLYPTQNTRLVGQHVVVFNGALGNQLLSTWDPAGFYTNNTCPFGSLLNDPECNYDRVMADLIANGFSESQVQAVFLKSADGFPQCDLGHQHCSGGLEDAYQAETYMGNIMRYLKCCKANGQPRYPNLKQVFITSRTYGGYAQNPPTNPPVTPPPGCLNPEPFSYEEGFSVQRLIVAQINQNAGITTPSDPYSGAVTSGSSGTTPWFDWGPYLWTNGVNLRSDRQNWCGGQTINGCNGNYDVREGDLTNESKYWGDFTHPSAYGQQKVANQLVNFIGATQGVAGSPWVTPWIQQ